MRSVRRRLAVFLKRAVDILSAGTQGRRGRVFCRNVLVNVLGDGSS